MKDLSDNSKNICDNDNSLLTGVCENLAEKCKNEKIEIERDLSEKTTKFERNKEADAKCVADLSKLRYAMYFSGTLFCQFFNGG